MISRPAAPPRIAPGTNAAAKLHDSQSDPPPSTGSAGRPSRSATTRRPSRTASSPPRIANAHHGSASRFSSWWPPWPPPCASCFLKMITARDGVIVSALTAEMIVDTAIVTANCWKNCPVIPLRKQQGTNTELRANVIAMIGPVISSIALIVAVRAS